MLVTDKLPFESSREYALRILKQNIINLELQSGSLLSEKDISSELGLSRTPVREALIELSNVKIVEILPQKGIQISLIDYSLVEEAQFLRFTLETSISELVCKNATDEDIEILKTNLKMQEIYANNIYFNKLLQLDNEFHKELFRIAKKSKIFEMMQRMEIHFDRVRSMSLTTISNSEVIDEHYKLFNTIVNRDAKMYRKVIEEHLTRYTIDKAKIKEKYYQYFK